MKIILEYHDFIQYTQGDHYSINQSNDIQSSLNGYHKHQDMLRHSLVKINDIIKSQSFGHLKSILLVEDQLIDKLDILKISKNNINYDVYIKFVIKDFEYWGVIKDILHDSSFESEVFRDVNIYQNREWAIRLKGIIIKNVKRWLMPKAGLYKLLNEEIICYSNLTGKINIFEKGSEIEVLKSYEDKIIFQHKNIEYTLLNDNFIYFNWWFEKID
jgi:hypothetical protein